MDGEAGKGDTNRTSDYKKYRESMDRIFSQPKGGKDGKYSIDSTFSGQRIIET